MPDSPLCACGHAQPNPVIRNLTDAGLSVLIGANPSREKEGFSIIPNWRMKQLSEAMTAAHAFLKANP
jgi:hypothetical protein